MRIRKFYKVSLVIAQTLLMGYPTWGSEQNNGDPSQSGQMVDVMERALTAQEAQGDENIKKRVRKRVDARKVQNRAEEIQKSIQSITSPLLPTITFAAAAGDPTVKLAATALRVAVAAVGELGARVADLAVGVSRYQERSQEILSVTEVLVESIQKSIDKIKILQKKQKELLEVMQKPEPSKSSSRLKQIGKNLTNIQNKFQEAKDILTNEKAEREGKLKEIQVALKAENENLLETVRLLQIKLLQDAVKEIDKKININDTIARLKDDISFYEKAKGNISSNLSKGSKQLADIDKKFSRASQDLKYYEGFQKSPTETPDALTKNKAELINQIEQLTKLTKLGDSLYLQEKGIDPSESQLDKATIVGLYRELDDVKSQIKALKEGASKPTAPSLRPSSPPAPSVNEVAKGRQGNLQRVLPSKP